MPTILSIQFAVSTLRQSVIARFLIFGCCVFAGAVGAAAQTVPLSYRPVTAEYSYGLDRIIFITANPSQLHIFDPISQSDTAVNLLQAPISLSVGPDGLHAAVGHHSLVSWVESANGVSGCHVPLSNAANGVVLGGDYVYYVYVFNPQANAVSISLATGTSTSGPYFSGISDARLHPSGTAIYLAGGDPEDANVSTGPITTVTQLASFSPYGLCTAEWFSPDGRRLYTCSAAVLRASPEDTGVTLCCSAMTLDTNADGLYWATLPTQIASLTESALLGRVATIPTQTEYGAPPVNDSRVHLYDSAYLDPAGEFQLPSFVANGQSYQAHGKQVFYNQASTALYVVMEADSTSGLLNGFAVQIYPITNFLPCSPTLGSFSASVEATGTIGTVAVTAAPGCSYDASSDSAWTQLVSGY